MSRWIFLFLATISPFVAFSQQFVQSQPIYHANGVFASSGVIENTFYHENGRVVWNGSNNIDPRVYHQNGSLAWHGYFFKECYLSCYSCSIYHKNGEKAWKGASYKEALFTVDASSIFHDNGMIAWRGALYGDCNLNDHDCSVFYKNGQLAWKGATPRQCYYKYETSTILHSNGKIAWRGAFEFETSSALACGVFHDNGNIAWSGRQGAPIYDRYGRIISAGAEAINMPLGENSWLYVSSNGMSQLHISIGEESFLTFSNQEENPRLLIHLGTGYNLECFPYTGNMPQISIYDTPVPVRDH